MNPNTAEPAIRGQTEEPDLTDADLLTGYFYDKVELPGRLSRSLDVRKTSITPVDESARTDEYVSYRELSSFVFPKVGVQPRRVKSSLQALQEWEGYVTDLGATSFFARLKDLTSQSDLPEEEGEFPLDDVADGDRPLLKPGAVFRWTIGYEKSRSGTKRRISQLVFRRLPAWTKSDIAAADACARRIREKINWE